MAALQDDLGPAATTLMSDQAQAKALSLQIFERTFVVTGALNVLTLSVAALALFASLVTLSGMRLAQLAPVWALGLTRRRLAALDLARGMVLAGLTASAGAAGGPAAGAGAAGGDQRRGLRLAAADAGLSRRLARGWASGRCWRRWSPARCRRCGWRAARRPI
jgi:hypothetical protein